MTETQHTTSDPDDRILSAKQLRDILRNPPTKFIDESFEEKRILIRGFTFEDEHLILDSSITLDFPLIFEGCTFKSNKLFFISGLTCNESLIFDGCTITESIFFNSGNFKKEVILKYVHAKHVNLSYCTFNTVSISGYNIGEIWVSGSRFKSLNIGGQPIDQNFGKLTIFAEEGETGDINVSEMSFNEIYLSGTNKGNSFNFKKIKCNNFSIISFNNEGSLNFYGLEPKEANYDKNYFQIIDSKLDRVQFHRAHFSKYKELIIIDSFITETLFIGCKWSNNIRALYGPGYYTFEDSLKNRRKTTDDEIVAIKEAYRQLKISMSKHSDKIQEHIFYSQELTYYNKTLSWRHPWSNQFWDKITLISSKTFSDYGQSFIKPLSWLFVGHYILFILALLFGGFDPLHISLSEPTASSFKEAFEKFFIYINPIRRQQISLSGYLIAIDLLMRIWSSYMIYNLIRASRRFIS